MELLSRRAALWTATALLSAAAARLCADYSPAALAPDKANVLWETLQQDAVEGRTPRALRSVRRLLRSFPENPLYLSREAELLEAADAFAGAARVWELFMTVSPTPTDACPRLGRDYEKLGQAQTALEAHRRCLALDPDNPDLILYLGLSFERTGRTAEARASFEKVLALNAAYDDAAVGLARLESTAGRHDQALRRLDALGPRGLQNTDALVARARALESLGRRQEAKELIKKALELSPNYEDLKVILSRLERETSR